MSSRMGGALIGLIGFAAGLLLGLAIAAAMETAAEADRKEAAPVPEAPPEDFALSAELAVAREKISRLTDRNAELEAELAEAIDPLNADVVTLVKATTALSEQFERERKQFDQEREGFEFEKKSLKSRLSAEEYRSKRSQETIGTLLDRAEHLSDSLNRANERLHKAGLPTEK